MSRWWATIPLAVAVAVPLCTTESPPIATVEAVAGLLCVFGIAAARTGPVTVGCIVAAIGYAAAVSSGTAGPDLIGGGTFGLALLFLLDVSEFARRFRGAAIAADVLHAQLRYWLERGAIIAGIVIVLALAGFMVSSLIPPGGRAVVAGLGALLAFVGALYGSPARAKSSSVK